MKRVLMVAFHFPPLAGSSGIQRTLRLVQHLPDLGWQPLVLSAKPMAYEMTSDDLLAEIPAGTVVRRAFALNSARHLAIRGRYLAATARPDRWMSWKFDAVRQGLQMIKALKPQLIWSTYPIASAHVIAAQLQQKTGIPWVADFRDPMAQEGYPSDPVTWQQFAQIEQGAIAQASAATFTTPGAVNAYRQRYPAASEKISLLENGYDEASFAAVEAQQAPAQALNPRRVTLLHSGVVYPDERDPTALFSGLQMLLKAYPSIPLTIRFRAPGDAQWLLNLARQYAVEPLLECLPPLPYHAALQEMLHADALLVLQASNCNAQIPAKVYEYFRARRPIVALTDAAGDTANLLRASGLDWIAPLDDASRISALLQSVVLELQPMHGALLGGLLPSTPPPRGALPSEAAIIAASRRSRSQAFVRLFNGVLAGAGVDA